jgi:hypothetical protein
LHLARRFFAQGKGEQSASHRGHAVVLAPGAIPQTIHEIERDAYVEAVM